MTTTAVVDPRKIARHVVSKSQDAVSEAPEARRERAGAVSVRGPDTPARSERDQRQ